MDYSSRPRAGFVGFGEVNTPAELIQQKCDRAMERLEVAGLELVKTAPVSDDPAGEHAARAVSELSAGDFDSLIICVAGWIPSWAVFSVIEAFRNKPMVLLGLTGRQEGDRFVTTADQAGTTALRKPMKDLGCRFKYVVNRYGAELPVDEIVSYCRAATAAACLRNTKICMSGYRDMKLYNTLYDAVSLKRKIGTEIEHLDLLELKQLMDAADSGQVKTVIEKMKAAWVFRSEPGSAVLEDSVRLYLAIRRTVEERGCDAFSYQDVDGIKKLLGFAPAGAMTLLHDEVDIATVPENDSLGAVTQLIVRALTGQVGAYLEFYEFMEDSALMGVPDYVPSEIVDGSVEILPAEFGELGEGLLNVSKLKTGRATICRLASEEGEYVLHAASGEAMAPPNWEEAGWAQPAPQLPGLRFVFDGDTRDFLRNVMGQHYIICYDDALNLLCDFAAIVGIRIIR